MFTDKMICQGSSGATINVATGSSISVQKGDTMTLIYENIGNVDWFRFVYDEGEK